MTLRSATKTSWAAKLLTAINHPRTGATTKELRQFGFMMGGFLIGLFGLFFPWILEKAFPFWPWYWGTGFIAFAIAWPQALELVFVYWMKFSHVLGYVNSRLLLGIFYYVVLFPIGLFRQLVASDPLARHFDNKTTTYRIKRSYDKNQTNMERPF